MIHCRESSTSGLSAYYGDISWGLVNIRNVCIFSGYYVRLSGESGVNTSGTTVEYILGRNMVILASGVHEEELCYYRGVCVSTRALHRL